jgi:predicted SPOUT superfamily RNA methylase MTH1
MAESEDRKRRKEEGRLQKRQKIDESGGVRPRKNEEGDESKESSAPKKSFGGDNDVASTPKNTTAFTDRRPRPKQFTPSGHRFGRVMDIVPCRNKPRYSTHSIALPGSVLSNCQTRELRTLLVGQIARAATIYHVDEIIVFDDKLAKNENRDNGGWRRPRDREDRRTREARQEKAEERKAEEKKIEEKKAEDNSNTEGGEPQQEKPRFQKSDPQTFMARLLQYCECPQYLRRHFFPMHPDLQFAGLLAPVDAPHHVRAEDRSKYREGVVLEKKSPRPDGGSLVNCGIRNRPVE